MLDADVADVVRIQLTAFPSFFLSRMGARVLTRFHRSIMRGAENVAIVAAGEEGVSGFVSGTLRPVGFYKRLLARGLHDLAPAVFFRCLREPSLFVRLLRRFRDSGAPSTSQRSAALLLIAVSPQMQKSGTGSALVDAFLAEAHLRGATAVALTTDAIDNDATLRFYERRGFRVTGSYVTAENRHMLQYAIDLAPGMSSDV